MAKNARASRRREKEKVRQQKQRDKAARRLEAKQHKAQTAPTSAGAEDPDIAGIRPGPQPLPAQWDAVDGE
jgi:hypothetical protein